MTKQEKEEKLKELNEHLLINLGDYHIDYETEQALYCLKEYIDARFELLEKQLNM